MPKLTISNKSGVEGMLNNLTQIKPSSGKLTKDDKYHKEYQKIELRYKEQKIQQRKMNSIKSKIEKIEAFNKMSKYEKFKKLVHLTIGKISSQNLGYIKTCYNIRCYFPWTLEAPESSNSVENQMGADGYEQGPLTYLFNFYARLQSWESQLFCTSRNKNSTFDEYRAMDNSCTYFEFLMFCRHSGLIKEKLIPKKHVLNLWKRFACINSREDTRGDNTVIDISGFISLLSMITIIIFSENFAYSYFQLDPHTVSNFDKVEALAAFLKLKNPGLLRSALTDPGAEDSARKAKDHYGEKYESFPSAATFLKGINIAASNRKNELNGIPAERGYNNYDDFSIPRKGDVQDIEMESTPLTCKPLTKRQELALIEYEKDRGSYDKLWRNYTKSQQYNPWIINDGPFLDFGRLHSYYRKENNSHSSTSLKTVYLYRAKIKVLNRHTSPILITPSLQGVKDKYKHQISFTYIATPLLPGLERDIEVEVHPVININIPPHNVSKGQIDNPSEKSKQLLSDRNEGFENRKSATSIKSQYSENFLEEVLGVINITLIPVNCNASNLFSFTENLSVENSATKVEEKTQQKQQGNVTASSYKNDIKLPILREDEGSNCQKCEKKETNLQQKDSKSLYHQTFPFPKERGGNKNIMKENFNENINFGGGPEKKCKDTMMKKDCEISISSGKVRNDIQQVQIPIYYILLPIKRELKDNKHLFNFDSFTKKMLLSLTHSPGCFEIKNTQTRENINISDKNFNATLSKKCLQQKSLIKKQKNLKNQTEENNALNNICHNDSTKDTSSTYSTLPSNLDLDPNPYGLPNFESDFQHMTSNRKKSAHFNEEVVEIDKHISSKKKSYEGQPKTFRGQQVEHAFNLQGSNYDYNSSDEDIEYNHIYYTIKPSIKPNSETFNQNLSNSHHPRTRSRSSRENSKKTLKVAPTKSNLDLDCFDIDMKNKGFEPTIDPKQSALTKTDLSSMTGSHFSY